jgi:D-alanyl-D-alanine carboxypeptidase
MLAAMFAAALAACGGAAASKATVIATPDYVRTCSAEAYAGKPRVDHVPVLPGSSALRPVGGELPLQAREALEQDLEWVLRNTAAPGITAAVGIPGKGIWSATRGVNNDGARTPFAAPALFHWASVGKAFTAMVIAQLEEEGRLSPDAALANWFPDFPNAQAITIGHLLTHTSGIYSYQADPEYRAMRGYQPPERAIEIAAAHGNAFCPGQYWSYSNTGYALLGKIIEKIEGVPFHQVVEQRIIARARLSHLYALAPGQSIAAMARIDDAFVPSNPFSAGNIVATSEDMVRFWHAFVAGQIIRLESLTSALSALYPMFGMDSQFYGRGIMLYTFNNPDGEKQVWIGHSGGTPGLHTVVAYDVRSNVIVAVAVNADVSPLAVANKLLGSVRRHGLSIYANDN